MTVPLRSIEDSQFAQDLTRQFVELRGEIDRLKKRIEKLETDRRLKS